MRLRIGYSCWGFLGNGIIDTPDGGRSHRLPLLKELISQNCLIMMLQKNRDLLEANEKINVENLVFENNFPNIDCLFLEYRWPILNRNCGIQCDNRDYTPDLDRQNDLIDYYKTKNIPIIIWDKDQKITELPKINNTIFFEPCLSPKPGRHTLLFPLSMELIKNFKNNIISYDMKSKKINLVYIGNQYERNESFKKWIDTTAYKLGIIAQVYGNWNKYPDQYAFNIKNFYSCEFKGRLPFQRIADVYKSALFTVLIAPDRYYSHGHFTQRIFESLCNLCIPFAPSKYSDIEKVMIPEFIINSPQDLVAKIRLIELMDNIEIANLLTLQIEKLMHIFSAKKQANIIIEAIKNDLA